MALLLSACQNSSEPTISPKNEVQQNESIHEDSKESQLDQEENPKTLQEVHRPIFFKRSTMDQSLDIFAQLGCPNCPTSIGQIMFQYKLKDHDSSGTETSGNKNFTKNCQGGLIGEDLFLTSRHCLPPEIQNVGDSCQENTVVILPRINDKFPLKVLDCDHLVSVSNTYDGLPEREIQPDWAILKLSESLPERFTEPTMRGIEDKERVFAFIPLKNPKTEEVTITTIECQGIQKSRHFPEFRSTQSPVAFLECDREMGKGFSGNLLFRFEPDNGYSPAATFSHYIHTKSANSADESPEENVYKSSKLIYASQMACVSSDEVVESDSCHFDPNQKDLLGQQLFIDNLEQTKAEIDGILSPLVQNENQPIQWERVHLENWETLPEGYLSFFKKHFEKSGLSKEIDIRFLQNLVPIYTKCVRPEFIDNENPYSKIPIQVPTTKVYLRQDEYRRVFTEYEINHLEGYLVPKRKDSSGETSSLEDLKFVIRFSSEVPPHNHPETHIARGWFYHSSHTIPICN